MNTNDDALRFARLRIREITRDDTITAMALDLTRRLRERGNPEIVAVQAGVEYAEKIVEERHVERPRLRLVHSSQNVRHYERINQDEPGSVPGSVALT